MEKNKVKVSVIVPVYNTEKYLRSCLDSIVKQELEDIEIIIIDDCSTDRSYEILKDYVTKFPSKIKVFRNEVNKGQGYSRNIGIKEACGEYIGFVDSDDYINPKMYSDMYDGAIKNDMPDVVSTGLLFVKDDYYLNLDLSFMKRRNGRCYNPLENFSSVKDDSPSACNKIFKRSFIGDIRFLEDTMWEDVAFSYSCLLNSDKILEMENIDYFYRKRADEGVSSKGFSVNSRLLDCFKVADEIEQRLKESGRFDKLSSQVKYFQIMVCLQRMGEVLKWNISDEDKKRICQYMGSIVQSKYGNISKEYYYDLVAKVGTLELEKIIEYMSSNDFVDVSYVYKVIKGM